MNMNVNKDNVKRKNWSRIVRETPRRESRKVTLRESHQRMTQTFGRVKLGECWRRRTMLEPSVQY